MKSRTRSTPARKAGRGRTARAASPPRARAGKSGELTLNADCTLAQAARLKTSLGGLLAEPHTVTLDAGAVQRIDTAALQLLAAFVRDRRLLGHGIQWRGAQQTLAPAARLLGMEGVLELPGESR